MRMGGIAKGLSSAGDHGVGQLALGKHLPDGAKCRRDDDHAAIGDQPQAQHFTQRQGQQGGVCGPGKRRRNVGVVIGLLGGIATAAMTDHVFQIRRRGQAEHAHLGFRLLPAG
ncbi:hypothetical protein GCM10007235_20640 [Pseudoxanthomonas indica]|nr:hypothetical protein GCM10007235_20640 [Pseudoxanthomonas indica]